MVAFDCGRTAIGEAGSLLRGHASAARQANSRPPGTSASPASASGWLGHFPEKVFLDSGHRLLRQWRNNFCPMGTEGSALTDRVNMGTVRLDATVRSIASDGLRCHRCPPCCRFRVALVGRVQS